MRYLLGLLFLSTFAFAKTPECRVNSAQLQGTADGISTYAVEFSDLRENAVEKRVTAHAYLPPVMQSEVPGIVATHSAIHKSDTVTDLTPVMRALARAGAATIVLDRTIQWDPLDDAANRDESVYSCAVDWLVQHAKLAPGRLMQAGPPQPGRVWVTRDGIGWPNGSVLNFGTTNAADNLNTEMLITREGQIRQAAWVTTVLHLRPIDPAWLDQPAIVAKRGSVRNP
jgi:hypothetical protein